MIRKNISYFTQVVLVRLNKSKWFLQVVEKSIVSIKSPNIV